jgi:hypothetical protein
MSSLSRGRSFKLEAGGHETPRSSDALGDLPEPNDQLALKVGGKWGDLLPSIPEGENLLLRLFGINESMLLLCCIACG